MRVINMKNVCSFSGGRSSAYLVYLMKKIDPFADFVFMDTGAEHTKTYEFIRNVVKHFNIKLTCLRVDINPVLGKPNSYKEISLDELKQDLQPYKDMMSKYGTPYIHGAFCTKELKTIPFTRYCDKKYGKGNYQTWLGIRADEPRRLKERIGYSYLADISDFDKADVLNWWSKQPFNLELDEHLGNCVFCIKKGINKIALACRDEQEMADAFISAVNDKSVRNVEKRKQHGSIMYRGGNSLISIIKLYENHSRDEILSTIRKTKSFDAGSCSESCEVF